MDQPITKTDPEVTLHPGEKIRLRRKIGERAYQLCKAPDQRSKLFREMYSALKLRYQVNNYTEIKQSQLQDALRFIATWDRRA